MAPTLFFASLFLVFFSYLGYPITLYLIGWLAGKSVKREAIQPGVTFIVTVHNEEQRIRAKLENTMQLEYPRENLQILVASDGSTDGTHRIVEEFRDRGVELLDLSERGGKEHAQKEAVKHARGEILVFSDVATILEPRGVAELVSNFADETVGCVSSEDKLLGRDGKPSGEGLYVKYEMWLRKLESRASSLVGLSGSLFAARREVCRDFSSEMQSDFRTVLNSVGFGLRGVTDSLAVGIYQDTADSRREWDRKIRTVVRGLTVFFRHVKLLNVFRYGMFSYQLFCHKLLRWLVPAFLVLAIAANVILVGQSTFYAAFLVLQLTMYAIGGIGMFKPSMQKNLLVRIPTYFLTVNVSILFAWSRYLSGQRIVTWAPTKR